MLQFPVRLWVLLHRHAGCLHGDRRRKISCNKKYPMHDRIKGLFPHALSGHGLGQPLQEGVLVMLKSPARP